MLIYVLTICKTRNIKREREREKKKRERERARECRHHVGSGEPSLPMSPRGVFLSRRQHSHVSCPLPLPPNTQASSSLPPTRHSFPPNTIPSPPHNPQPPHHPTGKSYLPPYSCHPFLPLSFPPSQPTYLTFFLSLSSNVEVLPRSSRF